MFCEWPTKAQRRIWLTCLQRLRMVSFVRRFVIALCGVEVSYSNKRLFPIVGPSLGWGRRPQRGTTCPLEFGKLALLSHVSLEGTVKCSCVRWSLSLVGSEAALRITYNFPFIESQLPLSLASLYLFARALVSQHQNLTVYQSHGLSGVYSLRRLSKYRATYSL